MGGLGDSCLPLFGLYFMVFKILQKLPLSGKGFLFQTFYALTLFLFLSVFGGSRTSFLFGFLFSQIYMLLFFYSASLLFQAKKRKLGLALMFIKWLSLFCVLILVSWFFEAKSFLLGLTGLLSFLLSYALEKIKKGKSRKTENFLKRAE